MSEWQESGSEKSDILEEKAVSVGNMLKDPQTGGMGVLLGKFNRYLISPLEADHAPYDWFLTVRGFVKNQEIRTHWENEKLLKSLGSAEMLTPQDYSGRFIWVAKKATPLIENIMGNVETKGLFGFRRRKWGIVGQQPLSVRGVHCEKDWTAYTLYMPIDHPYDARPVMVEMLLGVPFPISKNIDDAINQNPLFPDALFRNMYPGFVGPDKQKHVTRLPASSLLMRDYRPGGNPQNVIKPFTYTIPY